ncbi:hypothetical protein ZWY2020_040671 [Hordeum vulgare]|nr:hypothetical protein ZWY2020_040671 [Hordeum vulgare]
MLMRPWSSSGYRGIRRRPSGMFYVEIRSDDMRLGFGTFETAHGAARAYDAAAWRLKRPRAHMNFQDVFTCEHVHEVTPPPRVITKHDRRPQRNREPRLLIAEDEPP